MSAAASTLSRSAFSRFLALRCASAAVSFGGSYTITGVCFGSLAGFGMRLVHALKQTIKLGVIANQNYGTKQRLKNWGLLPFFEMIAASAELGLAKPDPAIFEWALKQAACSPQNAVMVGDRMDNDMAPANRLGIHTIRLKRGLGTYHEPQSDDEVPEYTVSTLAELLELL